jgi:hypothetical protein
MAMADGGSPGGQGSQARIEDGGQVYRVNDRGSDGGSASRQTDRQTEVRYATAFDV